MKTRLLIGLTVLVGLLATMAWAADVTGAWKAQIPGRDGQMREMMFTFKVDGETLTGTVGAGQNAAQITNGKVSGDDISFTVVRSFGGNEVKMLYTGKVSGDEIKFTQTREGSDRKVEFTAKKS